MKQTKKNEWSWLCVQKKLNMETSLRSYWKKKQKNAE